MPKAPWFCVLMLLAGCDDPNVYTLSEAHQRSRTSGVKASASMWLRSMRHLVNALFAFAPIENTIGRTVRLRKSYSPPNLRSVSDIGASKADLGHDASSSRATY